MVEDAVRIRAVVSGRVQGVGFRAFVLDHAEDLNLRGTVRNLPDGAVEVVAEGSADDVDHMVDLLRCGPMLARVRSVDVRTEARSSPLPSMRVTA